MDLTERILQGKRQNEALKSELQRLIELGLKGTGHKTGDPKEPPEVPVKSEPVVSAKNELARKQDKPPRRARSYDVEGVRRYMKEREKKRSESAKPEENKVQKELRKKRLEELHKKTLELVSKNVKKRRSKSANREGSLRPDHFEVSRPKFTASEQILSSSKIRSNSIEGKTDLKVPIQNVMKTVCEKSGGLPQNVSKRIKDPNKCMKSSTHSSHSQENIVIPEARFESNFVIENPENIPRNITKRTKSVSETFAARAPTDLDNLIVPEARLEPSLGVSKAKSLTHSFKSSVHSNNFPLDSQLEPHLNPKPEKLPRNVSKLDNELVKSPIHSIHLNENMLPHSHLESNFIISKRDTIPQNISIRPRRIRETAATNEATKSSIHSLSQDKPSVINLNLHLTVPENLQNITKRELSFHSNIGHNVNIPPFNPKICSTNVKTFHMPQDVPENFKDMKMWLHDSHDHPFNFVNTIKRKLDFTNHVDIGTQDSFPALDAHNIEHLNLVNNNNNKAVEKESDTSDTSKNIPDISMESRRSLKLNAESVKKNLSREFCNDDKKSLIESLRHNAQEDSHRSKSLRSNQLLLDISNKVSTESLHSRVGNNSEVSSKNPSDKTISQALCSKQYSALPVNSSDFSNKASQTKMASHENSSRKSPVKSLRNKHEVFLKFEAEFHLLDAFRESLLNYSALEESLMSLKNQNNVDVSDIIRPPLREVQSPSYQIGDVLDQSSMISSVNYSKGSESEMSLALTDRAEGVKPTNDLAAFSVQMFEQLIKDEESRLKNIQVNLQIREKVLLDRTKTELACLEIERKNLKAKGNVHEASAIKKKQRAIVVNHQKEHHEIKVLKQMQKAASEKRKTTLRQQEHLIKKQFCTEDVARKMRSRRDSRERRRTGPLKIPDSMSAMSEVTMSRSSMDRNSNMDFNEQQLSESAKDSDTQIVAKAINKQNEYSDFKREQLKKILLMHEETLEKRRKATEDLLKWHRRLAEEERRVNELESKADTVISRRKTLLHNEHEKKHNFTGRELNQMWYTLTDNEEVKFAENKVYSLSQTALEKFCRNAKEHLMKAGKDGGDLADIIGEFKEEVQEEQRYQDETFEVDTDASTNKMVSGEIVTEQEQSLSDEISTAPASDTENFVKTEVSSKLNKQISTSGNIVTTLEDILSRTEADLKQIVAQFEIRENTTEDVSTSLNQSNASLAINEEMKQTSVTNVEEEVQEDEKSGDDIKTTSSISVESSINEGNEGMVSSIIEDLVKSEIGENGDLGVLEEKSSNIEHNDDIEAVNKDISSSVFQAVEIKARTDPDEHVTTIVEDDKSSLISSKIEQLNEISKAITENLEESTGSPLSPAEKLDDDTDPNEHEKSPNVSSEKQQVTEPISEDDSSLSQDGKIGDETYLINSVEENEKSPSVPLEEKSKIEISDVKQRVHEIMDAHQVSKDRSPRVQDLYVTTYDLVSPTNSPDSGSPVSEKALAVSSIFGNEAEELLKKQLAIEQEIKQITEQQRKEKQVSYMYVREIPNKPPPPYTPPGSIAPLKPLSSETSIIPSIEEVHDIVPSCARILHKAYLSKTIETVSISENTMNLILTDMPKGRFRFIFDLCKDIARRHYCRFEEKVVPSWLKEETPGRRWSKPLDPKGLERYLEDSLRELFGFEKSKRRENSIIKWSRKKRDHVDEVLVRECQDEEPKWTSCEKDKKLIMDQMVNEVMKLLIEDSCGVMEKLFRRTELKVEVK